MRQINQPFDLNEPEIIEQPLDTDILCGKTKECISHIGSKSFRQVIEDHKELYDKCDSKLAKMEVTKRIYEMMLQRCNARFLKFDPELQGWQVLSGAQVRDKIGHALRFALKSKKIRRRPVFKSSPKLETVSLSDSSTSTVVGEPDFRQLDEDFVPQAPPLAVQTSVGMIPIQKLSDDFTVTPKPVSSIIEYFQSQYENQPSPKEVLSDLPNGQHEKRADYSTDMFDSMQEPLVEWDTRQPILQATTSFSA